MSILMLPLKNDHLDHLKVNQPKIIKKPNLTLNISGIADSTIDISAILGTYQAETEDEKAFVSNMQKLFASFVTNGNLPEMINMNHGMYVVDKEVNTQRSYPHCDFWKNALDIVPTYAALD